MRYCNLLAVFAACCLTCYSTGEDVPLRVLALVPFPDNDGGWDQGLELLPAARVAVKEVNRDQYTLPGYKLELVERASDACARTVIRKGLSNLIINSLSTTAVDNNTIAVVGLACSTVTASVSPIAGRDEVDLLQLAMANSNIFRSNIDQYPHLWRFLATSDHLVLTLEAFADYIGWNRFGLIFDGQGFFFNAIAATFRDIVERNEDSMLLVDQALQSADDSDSLSAAFNLIQSQGVRVMFSPTTIPESVAVMCQAAKRGLVWPAYVWVFPSRRYEEFKSNSDLCDEPERMMEAVENVLLITSDIASSNDSHELLTGRTYGEYMVEYTEESKQLQKEEVYVDILREYGFNFSNYYNVYANLMYNEIWALALALNDSLPEITERGFDLGKYQFNQSNITSIIEKNLKKVSFQGTLGLVEFDEFRETGTDFVIHQVRNRTEIIIGRYHDKQVQLMNITKTSIPGDDFEAHYVLINSGLAGVIYTQAILLSIFITAMFVLLILLRKEPEVRASSPLLSIHIFIGCYLLLLASILLTTRQFVIMSSTGYQVVCYIGDLFGYIGLNLISGTILLRLARVYRIFTKVTKISWVWKNKPLFVFTVLIAIVPVIFTLIELAVQPKQYQEDSELVLDQTPPMRMITIRCYSKYADIFETIIIAYIMLIIIVLLTLAVLTRNIHKRHFNDTKKVTAFVFLFTLCGTVFVPVSYILKTLGNDNNSVVLLSYMNHLTILISLSLLIVPKVIPTFYYRYFANQERNVHEEQNQDEDVTIYRLVLSPLAKKLQARFGNGSNTNTNTAVSQLPIAF